MKSYLTECPQAWFNIILKQLNAGGSVRTVVHFAQMILSGESLNDSCLNLNHFH